MPQRIAAARRYAKLSQQALADAVGVSRPAVSQWEKEDGGTSPSRENLVGISRATGAPLEWLTDDTEDVPPFWSIPQQWEGIAEEPMTYGGRTEFKLSAPELRGAISGRPDPVALFAFSAMDEVDGTINLGDEERDFEVELPDHVVTDLAFAAAIKRDFVFVPLLNMHVSAGGGSTDVTGDVDNWYAYRRNWLVYTMGLDPEHCGIVIARGDSGEPDIRDKDLLLVDFRVQSVKDPGVYILAIDGEYIVKQAQRNWDGSVTISSANTAYAPSTVPPERLGELTVVGRVRSQQRRR